jgi:D-beta-D-heptose 7-phosphate kinase/D-beta-D-heptose 1-phosphate adenosyltransferase
VLKFLNKTSTQFLIQEKFPEMEVAVIGDLMLDRYLWGKVSRISPEAPVPVVQIEQKTVCLGGAGNVACNLAALGCQVFLAGVIGADLEANLLIQEMQRLNLITDGLVVDSTRPTTVKTRVIGKSQQVVRLDEESTAFINEDIEKRLLDYSLSLLEHVNIVILSDYKKGVLTDNFLMTFLHKANLMQVPVLVDPKRQDYTVYTGATAITPNRSESELALNRSLVSDQDFEIAALELQRKYALEAVLITRSEQGMTLLHDTNLSHLPASSREVFDVSGAGDCVIATLAAALSAGLSWAEAAELANLSAGITIQKVGTAPVRVEELLQVLEQEGIASANSKVLEVSELMRRVAIWRAEGKIIAFTNGCFDLLHVGHVSYLDQAKAMADVLIVGLNTDSSVKRLKGAERPIIPEFDRARVLAALSSVSAVVLFDEDTPIELIQSIKPDLLIKGADYQGKEVIGAEFVRSYQGRVELIPLVEDRSTTNIVKKLRRTSSYAI